MAPHYNVLIATPGQAMTPAYVKSLVKTIRAFEREGVTWDYLSAYSSLVAHAREQTIGGDGNQDATNSLPMRGACTYDRIMWIDSDISWEPSDVFRLIDSPYDIVSGCYLIEDGTCTAYYEPLGQAIPGRDIVAMKEPFKVFGVGFGFLCIRSGIFERIKRPWFSQEEIAVTNKETGEVEYKFPLMGEDLSWCNKVQKMGLDVWVDPRIKVTHQKRIMLDWTDIQNFASRRA